MAKHLSTKEINLLLDKIENRGLKPVSEYGYVTQDYYFSTIIKPLGLKGGGRIMEYSEYLKFQNKQTKGKVKPLSYKQYRNRVIHFAEFYKDRLSVEGELQRNIEFMKATISQAEIEGFDFSNIDDITLLKEIAYDILVDAFREADKLQRLRHDRGHEDSGKRFYADLSDAFKRLSGLSPTQNDYFDRLKNAGVNIDEK